MDKETQRKLVVTQETRHRTVYIGNLPKNTPWQILKDAMSDIKVDHVEMLTDKASFKKMGVAIVTCKDVEEAGRCIELWHGKEFQGRALVVRAEKFFEAEGQVFIGNVLLLFPFFKD